MALSVRNRSGGDLPDKVRSYAESKAAKLERYFHDLLRLDLVLAEERGIHIAELTAEGDGALLRSQERNGELQAAIGAAIAKLERQAKRFKTRIRAGQRRVGEDPIDDEGEGAPEDFTPVVARRKRYTMKPMAVEEAARQLELVDHDFYMFRNEATGDICTIYRRRDGDYGLIEADD